MSWPSLVIKLGEKKVRHFHLPVHYGELAIIAMRGHLPLVADAAAWEKAEFVGQMFGSSITGGCRSSQRNYFLGNKKKYTSNIIYKKCLNLLALTITSSFYSYSTLKMKKKKKLTQSDLETSTFKGSPKKPLSKYMKSWKVHFVVLTNCCGN